jgi:hypothetical protein
MEMSNVPESCEKEAKPEVTAADVDLSLVQDSLAMTPWERMQANDDAVNFADTLRAAMQERHEKPD